MDDTISRRAAIEAMKGLPTWWADAGGYYGKAQPPMEALLCPEDVIAVLENLPSAQPEIIRCKDCKHLQKWRSEESAKKFGQIYECGKGVLREPVPDGSCSKAERRTDEGFD